MKNLMKALGIAGVIANSLIFSGCTKEEVKTEVERKNIGIPTINNTNNPSYYVEESYHTFTLGEDTIEACKFHETSHDGIVAKTTKKCTTYVYRFEDWESRDTILNLFVTAKNFSQEYSFLKNSKSNSLVEEKAEAKGYTLLHMYQNILYKEKLTEDSIQREKQKVIDNVVLRNL